MSFTDPTQRAKHRGKDGRYKPLPATPADKPKTAGQQLAEAATKVHAQGATLTPAPPPTPRRSKPRS